MVAVGAKESGEFGVVVALLVVFGLILDVLPDGDHTGCADRESAVPMLPLEVLA